MVTSVSMKDNDMKTIMRKVVAFLYSFCYIFSFLKAYGESVNNVTRLLKNDMPSS